MAAQSRPTLLLTRPEPAATRFAAQLRDRFGDGLEILSSPLMAPVFLAAPLPGGGWQGTIFTSETGVEGLRRLTDRRGPAICVGPRTAEAAQAAGWQAEVIGGDAEGLVAALAAQPRPGLWLHARGREAAGDLAARLRKAGMSVAEAVVYAQEPRPLTDRRPRPADGRGSGGGAVIFPAQCAAFRGTNRGDSRTAACRRDQQGGGGCGGATGRPARGMCPDARRARDADGAGASDGRRCRRLNPGGGSLG